MLPGTAAVEPGPVRRRLAGFPALRHRNFRLFVVGQGISLVGYWMQSVAQGWLVYRLEGRPLDLGKVAVAGYLPILCLAPLAGVVADRLPRRRVLLVTQALLGLLALALGVLVWTGAVTVPLVVLFAGGVGLVSALDVPTRQSFLVEMTSAEDLPNAIALNSSIFNGARLVGPALAGALVAALGEAPCFFLNAASYVAVLVALALMRLPPSERPRTEQALGAGFLSGLRYVWGAPVLRNLLLLLGVVSGLGVQYNLLLPVFARTVFGTNALGYGLLHTAGGVGAIAAALQLAAHRYSRAQHRRHLHTAVLAALKAADDGTFDYRLSGPVVFLSQLSAYAGRMILYFPLSLLVIGLVHYEAFRTLQALFLPLLTALLSVLWAVGLMGLLGVPLDPFNTTTPILILAVAAGHAVQVLKRFYEEFDRTHDVEAAIAESLARVGPVMIAAGMIAALSFCSLVTFRTATIRTFGLFTGFGILSALVIELTIIPAVRAMLPTPRRREREREAAAHPWLEAFLRASARAASGRGRRQVFAGAAVLIAACAVFASRIQIDMSTKREFSAREPVRRDDATINAHFAGEH